MSTAPPASEPEPATLPPPALVPMTRVCCRVGPLVSLGAAPHGERRYVPLTGGTLVGPELNGDIVDGGFDWQVLRADGVLEISAHYAVRLTDGALVEVRSDGLRFGDADVMAALARGETVPPEAYVFRTVMRFQTGAPAWLHLNRVLALTRGQRHAAMAVLDVYRVQ